jgi:hypothetical protein
MTTPQTITNLGTGGADLNAVNGSTSGADTNDALKLDWPGDNAGNYLYVPAVVGNFVSVPDNAALEPTDLDIRMLVAADTWTGANQYFGGKWGAAGNRSWYLYISTTGLLRLFFTADGTTTGGANATAAVPFTNGLPYWIRWVLDVNNGSGGYDVKFYWAAASTTEPTSWTQIGATVTVAGTSSVFNSTADVYFTSISTATTGVGAKLYRAIIKNGIDGTSVLDIDTSRISSGTATSFTAATGQTVTIGRAATGLKTVAVVSPVYLFASDDYWEIADNTLVDFTASESFTVVAVIRSWATLATNDAMVAKKADTTATTAGWALTAGSSTAAQAQFQAGDGAAGATAVSGNRTAGALSVVAAVRNVGSDTLTTYLNGVAGTSVTDTTTTTLANSEAVRIARLSGAGTEYSDFEVLGVAVFRRALSADEISSIVDYYESKVP